jgi:hypothetical protein
MLAGASAITIRGLRWLNKVDVCLAEMSPAPLCTRAKLILELSETLFDALQITAAQRGMSMAALCEAALQETQRLPRLPGEQGFIPSRRVAGPGRPAAINASENGAIRKNRTRSPATRVRTKPAAWQQAL